MHRRKFIGSGSALVALSLMTPTASRAAQNPGRETIKPRETANSTLQIKDIVIGAGQPKVIVSTTSENAQQTLQYIDSIADRNDFNVLELRIDALENGTDATATAKLTQQISSRLGNKLLLVTFRTSAEGGKKTISDREYAALYRTLLEQGEFDLLDIEMFRDKALTTPLITLAHKKGRYVILSSHELHSTPSAQTIVSRLREQQARGADILKFAAMPQGPADVLTLLNATLEMHQRYAQRPLLTMSMGETGVLSRMSGELTGSALTFGMIGDASASGQVAAEDLHNVLDVVHKGMAS